MRLFFSLEFLYVSAEGNTTLWDLYSTERKAGKGFSWPQLNTVLQSLENQGSIPQPPRPLSPTVDAECQVSTEVSGPQRPSPPGPPEGLPSTRPAPAGAGQRAREAARSGRRPGEGGGAQGRRGVRCACVFACAGRAARGTPSVPAGRSAGVRGTTPLGRAGTRRRPRRARRRRRPSRRT